MIATAAFVRIGTALEGHGIANNCFLKHGRRRGKLAHLPWILSEKCTNARWF